jgi:hypothetical protein
MTYLGFCLLTLVLVSAGLWPWLEAFERSGLVWAAAGSLVVQGVAFGLLIAVRSREKGLLLGMAGGTALRLGALATAGLVVTFGSFETDAAALVLGLAGFLFALSLLEALFVRRLNGR